MAASIPRIPAAHASSASSSVRIRCPTDSATATSTAASDAHIIALYESADEMMSRTESPSPVTNSPTTTPTTRTRMGRAAFIRRGGVPGFGARARSSAAAPSTCEPGCQSCPVSRARRSARSIGPKSRRVSATA